MSRKQKCADQTIRSISDSVSTKEMANGFKGVNQQVANANQKVSNKLNSKIETAKAAGKDTTKYENAMAKADSNVAKYSAKAGSTVEQTQANVASAGKATFGEKMQTAMQFGSFLQQAGAQLGGNQQQGQVVAQSNTTRLPGFSRARRVRV